MSWNDAVDDLRRREALAERMGGAAKVARQHARGKMDARARIAALADLAPSNFIFGRADIATRAAVVSADDFTVRGGVADAAIHLKFVQCEKMAHEYGLPLVRMIDGTGGGSSVKTLEEIGATYVPAVPGWSDIARNLERVRAGSR